MHVETWIVPISFSHYFRYMRHIGRVVAPSKPRVGWVRSVNYPTIIWIRPHCSRDKRKNQSEEHQKHPRNLYYCEEGEYSFMLPSNSDDTGRPTSPSSTLHLSRTLISCPSRCLVLRTLLSDQFLPYFLLIFRLHTILCAYSVGIYSSISKVVPSRDSRLWKLHQFDD